MLRACYDASFALAAEHGVSSIAFPAISTGVHRFPKDRAAGIALQAMRAQQERFRRIVVCCFSGDDAALYRGIAAAHHSAG